MSESRAAIRAEISVPKARPLLLFSYTFQVFSYILYESNARPKINGGAI